MEEEPVNFVRLNLGCGNKLYPQNGHWINVDIDEPDSNKVTALEYIDKDTTFDKKSNAPLFHASWLNNLKYVEDDVADEIHAYHVIEHFKIYEVEALLAEWKRVLKPGGVVVFEAPDVLKAAAWLLAGAQSDDLKLEFHYGMLAFYGQPLEDKPYMSHCWGWYPKSLMIMLQKCGFVNVREEPAQTHMKNVRDFRVVGEVPLDDEQ